MFKNLACKIIVIVGIIAELSIGILYHIGLVNELWAWMIIIAAACALMYIVTNNVDPIIRSVLYAIVIAAILIGAGRLSVSAGSTTSFMYINIKNQIMINNIEHESEKGIDSYIHLFDYGEKRYYTDAGYTYLYEIKDGNVFSEIIANGILIESDFNMVLDESFTDFYSIDDNNWFTDRSDDQISIAFYMDGKEDNCLIKILSPKNKVFYSYINIDKPLSLIKALGLEADNIKIGDTNIVLTPTTIISDGTGSSDETKEGKSYLLTLNNEIYASETFAAKFEEGTLYEDRINWFIYKDVLDLIEEYKIKIEDLDPESPDREAMEAQISLLESSISTCQIELVYENAIENGAVRLYRIKDYSSIITEVPPISVIEIKVGDIYTYGLTDLTLDEF